MKALIIIGAGDFGREAAWVAERVNAVTPTYQILGFVDDKRVGEIVSEYPVLGNVEWLLNYPKQIYTVCAISNGRTKKEILEKIRSNALISEISLIDPAAVIGDTCRIGNGSIICAGVVMTVDAVVGKGCIINLNCTVGHDAVVGDFCAFHPGCNISGKTFIGEGVLLGTGSQVIQGVSIASNTVIGAGAVVIHDIKERGTYVGVPARKIK